ncbi:terminase small subunit [Halalkalibacter krulwichiae]|uniref:Terminase small subunit n=1 Tax=Halalkalibacter krulwichiae TaxID=199441 RepID=A0A1X9M7Y7_9BACI|nr:terminase small subunit [Halalkalibacter krulwichiae]ARK28784.1 Terminase small subunit [Halalkalibacter krulwichiae]
MARQRDPRRDEAFEIWKKSKGEKKLKDIAAELGVSDTQVRKWKSQDKWEPAKGNVTNSKSNVTKQKNVPVPVIENDDLNDNQKMFCLYYLKYYNAIKAYQKAYDCDYKSAHSNAHRMMANEGVRTEIQRLKAEQQSGVFLDAQVILQKYMDIAFADITDFLTFGRKEVEVDKGENGEPIMVEVNYVEFKNSHAVDGTIVTEVKQGKDGVSIKLADKMKALEKLEKYVELLSDTQKSKLEEEKLLAETVLTKAKAELVKGSKKDTSLLEALINLRSESE